MATNVRKIDNLDVPFKEFMPGQIIQSGQFNDDMKDIEDKVNEIIGEQNTLVDEVNAHTDNFENPHQVTAHQTGTYTSEEIDEFIEDIKSGNLHDNAIGNRVLDDDCVSTRNILDGSVTSSKLDSSVGSQIDISTNVSIKDRYTKEETDLLIQEKVGDGTYDKATIDEKLEQIQAGQILDKSISIHQLKDDVGRRLDISNNPDILNKYTRDEVDLLIQNNALPRDWGSILEEDNDTPIIIPTKEITLPVANHMKVNTCTVSESSILDIDIQENVDARGEFNTVGERLNSVDSQIKEKANRNEVKNRYFDGENQLKQFNGLSDITFRRKHSLNLRKTLQYNLSNMSFDRKFVDVEFSDLYPNLETTRNQTETIINNEYTIRQNSSTRNQIRRLFTGFNIFSSYEFEAHTINGGSYGCRTGFSFDFPGLQFNIMFGFKAENKIDVMSEKFVNGVSKGVITHTELSYDYTDGIKICITNFNDKFEIYLFENNRYEYKLDISFEDISSIDKALNGKVSLYCRQDYGETITFKKVKSFYDCGLTQGDIRPIRYRNGSPIINNGKLFFTTSSRFNNYSYQTILSKTVNGNEYKLEGVLLFEYNGKLCSDIASSIVYDNEKGRFIIWNVAFSQNHILGYGECYSDILFGVNMVKMQTMEKEHKEETIPTISDDRLFFAKCQDEDPDIIFNEKTKKWNLVICRTDSEFNNNVYNYFLFESDNPFTDFTFVSKTDGENNVTGGSIVKICDTYYLIYGGGNSNILNKYYYSPLDNLSKSYQIIADSFDGGFRGWGSIYPLTCGNYTKYCWITFDRSVVSSNNHSYGNLYYFESNLLNLGNEHNVKYSY